MSSADQSGEIEPTRPLLRDWFWRPWYAKAWLFAAISVQIAPYVALPFSRSAVADSQIWMLLTVTVGNPYLILAGLGFGYFKRAWAYQWRGGTPLD